MKKIKHFKKVNLIPYNLKNKLIGLLKMVNDYWDLEYILKMEDIYILYDNKKIYSVINYYGKVDKNTFFFFDDNKDIDIFNICFYNDYDDSQELLNYLNQNHKNILVWSNDNIYKKCFPDNFYYQKQYKENISILSEDCFCFDYCYISNISDYYLLDLYLKYQCYNNVDIEQIKFKLIDNLYELTYDSNNSNIKLPINFNSTSCLKLCEPYDEEGKHVIGLYKDIIVFDLCVKSFYNKMFLYYISTRKDLYNKGIAKKGIEFLSTLNFYDIIYGTDLTDEGQQAHINDIMQKYLKDKFIPSNKRNI